MRVGLILALSMILLLRVAYLTGELAGMSEARRAQDLGFRQARSIWCDTLAEDDARRRTPFCRERDDAK